MQASNPDEQLQSALKLHQSGRFSEAGVIYQTILVGHPDHSDALHLLGVLADQTGDPETAVTLIRRAITIRPDADHYHSNLGIALRKCGRVGEAIAEYREALHLRPDAAHTLNNLGNALRESGELAEATASLRRAVELKPDYSEALANLGMALTDQGEPKASLPLLERALQLQPASAPAHWSMALALLLLGELKAAWPHYRWRTGCPSLHQPREFPQPLWNGEDLHGRTILLHSEQGNGDTLQFIRYAPLVAARGGQVVLLCDQPGLSRLLENVAGVGRLLTDQSQLPAFDVHCPLLSLPEVFDTSLETIPASPAYLRANEQLTAMWSHMLGPRDGKLRVGIVWAGSPGHKNDRNRSMRVEQFAALANVSNVEFHSLQKGPAAEQSSTPPRGFGLIDRTGQLADFADTAALIANLDLVISVDTSVVHLAGAMGKPVWVLLPLAPDWRWMLDREDTPWYPTIRLFRQDASGEWEGVVHRIAIALRAQQAGLGQR
jgi:Flp pilus assembly protein TadD